MPLEPLAGGGWPRLRLPLDGAGAAAPVKGGHTQPPVACSGGLLTALWSGRHLLPGRQVGFPGPRPACWPVPCVHSVSHIGAHIAFLQAAGLGGGAGSCRGPRGGPHRVPPTVRVSSGLEGRRGLWGGPSSLLPPGAHMHTRMCTHTCTNTHTHVHTHAHKHAHTRTWEQAPSVFSRAPHRLHLVPDSWAARLV